VSKSFNSRVDIVSGNLAAACDLAVLEKYHVSHILTIDSCPLPSKITHLPHVKTKYIQCKSYSGVIPNMSIITLHLGLSIFLDSRVPRTEQLMTNVNWLESKKIERSRCRVIPDM